MLTRRSKIGRHGLPRHHSHSSSETKFKCTSQPFENNRKSFFTSFASETAETCQTATFQKVAFQYFVGKEFSPIHTNLAYPPFGSIEKKSDEPDLPTSDCVPLRYEMSLVMTVDQVPVI